VQVSDDAVEKFRPTSGRITGALGLVLVAAIVLIGVLDRDAGISPVLLCAALVVGVVIWATMLRPRLWATDSALVMRNSFSTVTVPLAAIEQIAVRQVCAVRVGDQRYVSPAVGKSWRQALRSDRKLRHNEGRDDKEPQPGTMPYAGFVEDRLHQLAEEARTKAGVGLLSDEQLALASDVRREWAWPEIVALGLGVAGLVVALVV
jgi:hypothetical protein